MPTGGLLEDLLTAAATEPDAEPVAVRLCGWREHTRLLRTGEADAALMFAPYDPDGIDADIVALEPASPRCPRTTPSRLPPGYCSPTSTSPPKKSTDGQSTTSTSTASTISRNWSLSSASARRRTCSRNPSLPDTFGRG
ncbi:hypothetical protein [Streptomyces mirabilis]|uniref:hypothetical protein n=1 Tax=Streptomyces mirabilis TaxID=68239 RepID=UPI0035D8A6A9